MTLVFFKKVLTCSISSYFVRSVHRHARVLIWVFTAICLTFHGTFSSWFALHCYIWHFWAGWDFAMNCWNNFFVTHPTLCLFCVYSYSRRLLVDWDLALNYWNNFSVTHPTLCSFCSYSYVCHLWADGNNFWNNFFVAHPTLCSFCFYRYVCHLWADGNISLVLDILHHSYLPKTFFSCVQKVGSISVRK